MNIDRRFPTRGHPAWRLLSLLACITGLGTVQAASAACCADPLPLLSRTYGPALAIDVEGGLAAVAIGSQVALVDVSAPTLPHVVGRAPALRDAVVGLDLAGDRVYAAAGALGVRVIDIARPDAPIDVGGFDTAGLANGIVVERGLAYVADGPEGLRILDVADPAAIREIGVLDTPGEAVAVAVGRGHAFVADFEGGLRVIDVVDPAQPREVAVLRDGALRAWDVALRGSALVVSLQPDRMWHVDVSTPAAPRTLATTTLGRDEPAGDIALTASAIVHAGYGLKFREPRTGAVLALYDAVFDYVAVATEGSLVYTTSNLGGLYIVDASHPDQPALLGGLALVDDIEHVAIDGDTAYVAARMRLQRLDLRERPMPREVAKVALPGDAQALAVAGRHLLVAAGSPVYADLKTKRLLVFDVGGGGVPALVASLDFIDTPRDIVVDGNLAYVAFGSWYVPGNKPHYRGGLRIFDIADPTAPALVGTIPDDEGAWESLALVGTRLFARGTLTDRSPATNDTRFLRAVDVVDPARPAIIGDIASPAPSDLQAFAGYRDRLLVAVAPKDGSENDDILSLDVSNPRFPAVTASQSIVGFVESLGVDGDHLFVASNREDPTEPRRHGGTTRINVARLTAFDVSLPDQLERVAAAEVTMYDSSAVDLAVGGGYAGLAAGTRGLWVFDVGAGPVDVPTPSATVSPTDPPATTTASPTPEPSATASTAPTETTVPPTATATAMPTSPARAWRIHLPVAYRMRDDEVAP